MQAGYAAVLAKLDTMDQNQQQGVLDILASLNNVSSQISNLSTQVRNGLNAVIGNMVMMSAQQQMQVMALLAKLDQLKNTLNNTLNTKLDAFVFINSPKFEKICKFGTPINPKT